MKKEKFLAIIGNWSNHRYLLWEALEATKHLKLPTLELGCGMGSTEYLREYCRDEELEFHTYDSSEEYAKQFNSVYVRDWNIIPWAKQWGVVLVDESPGEHRKIAIPLLENATIIVCHDTEEAADHGYQMRKELFKFKYMIDWKSEGAWASAVSNSIDVTKWKI